MEEGHQMEPMASLTQTVKAVRGGMAYVKRIKGLKINGTLVRGRLHAKNRGL